MEQPLYSNGLLRDRVSQLEREVKPKTQENEQLHQQLSSFEERLHTFTRLQEEVREKEDTITRLEGEARGKEDAITRLEGEARGKEDAITRLEGEARGKEDAITRLEGEAREKEDTITRLQEEGREKEDTITRLEWEVRGKEDTITRLQEEKKAALSSVRDQLTGQRERHDTELRQVREQYQQQLEEERAHHQLLESRTTTAMSNLRGEPISPQSLEMWELPREEVHISQTLLGTGGWGYVARGTFQEQTVAVKCLHRAILSPQNEWRLRREISIMSQVRHPNLLLLIGAVLTTEREGPLIVSELLDTSLRSAYEEGSLEERSKVPVLRDVASALTYLHSHRTPILHRDVSSANVLLEAIGHDRRWKAKLSDFGSANLSQLASTPFEGAAVYSAPEVSTEDQSRQTSKIDVYSFGVLVCEVCLCQFPPERHQFPSMLSDVCRTTPSLFPLSRDCTSHSHHDRPTMREIVQRIDQI